MTNVSETRVRFDSKLGIDEGAVLIDFSMRELLRAAFLGAGTRCQVADKHLTIKTAHGNIDLPTAKIKLLQFRHDIFSLHVVATMTDGGTFRGKLVTKRLRVRYPSSAGLGSGEINCRKLSYIYAHSLDAPITSTLEDLNQTLKNRQA